MADLSNSQLGVTSFMSGLNNSSSEETLLEKDHNLQSLPAAASASMPDLSIMTPRPQSSRFSPSKPLSLREYEQQLSDLRKENFNLKLRIYFLEEQLKENLKLAGEDVHKLNVELRVEVDRLKEDLEAKQGLLLRFRESVQTIQRNKQIDIDEAIEEERNRCKAVEEELQRANEHINSLDGQMEAASQRIVELELLNSQLQRGSVGEGMSRPNSGEDNLPAFESDSEMHDISACLLTGKEKKIMDLKANLVYQEQEWQRLQQDYDERIRLLQNELDAKTEVIRQLMVEDSSVRDSNVERLCKSCQSSPVASARFQASTQEAPPYDMNEFSMLNGADITSGPIMVNSSRMSILGHISTGPYNTTAQGTTLYDAMAMENDEKLTNLQDLCAEKEMKVLELSGLLETRQIELNHLRCELERSHITIAELEAELKTKETRGHRSPRSKLNLERRDTGTGSASSIEGDSEGSPQMPVSPNVLVEKQRLEDEIRQAESVNNAFQSLIESQKSPGNFKSPAAYDSSMSYPPSSTVETLRARLDHLSRSNEHLRKSLQMATSTPESVPQISHFLSEWELLNKSVEHSENLNRVLIEKFSDIMGRAMTEAPSLQNVFGRHKLFDDIDFSQSPSAFLHSRSQQRLNTPRVTFTPEVSHAVDMEEMSANRQANLKSIMKPLNYNVDGSIAQRTPASLHTPQCDGAGGMDVTRDLLQSEWNMSAATPSLSFSRYVDSSMQDMESLRAKLADTQSVYLLLKRKLEGTVAFLKQLLAMLGASPEFSQYSGHLESIIRELSESIVVTADVVEAFDGVKSGLLEISSHFYSNMSGSAFLDQSHPPSAVRPFSQENGGSPSVAMNHPQSPSHLINSSSGGGEVNPQNNQLVEAAKQELEDEIATKSVEIFRLNEEINRYRVKMADYEATVSRYKSLLSEAEEKTKKIEESKTRLASDIEEYKLKRIRYEDEVSDLKRLLHEADERVKNVTDSHHSAERDVEQSQKEVAEIRAKLSAQETHILGLRSSLQETQARAKLMADSEKRLHKETEELKSKLAVCEQHVTELKSSLKTAQNECRKLSDNLDGAAKSLVNQSVMTDSVKPHSVATADTGTTDYWKKRSEKLERYAKSLKSKMSEGHRSMPTLRINSSDVATSTDLMVDQSIKSRSLDIEPLVQQIRNNNEELGKKVDVHDIWKKQQKAQTSSLVAKIEQLEKQLAERQDKYELLKREYVKLKGFCQGKDVEIKALRDRTNCVSSRVAESAESKTDPEGKLVSLVLEALLEKFQVTLKELKVLAQHAGKHGDSGAEQIDGCLSYATELQCCIGGLATGLEKHLQKLKSARDISLELEREVDSLSIALSEMRQQMANQEGVLQNMSDRLQAAPQSEFDKGAFEKLILKELVQTQRYLRKAKEIMETKKQRKLRKATQAKPKHPDHLHTS